MTLEGLDEIDLADRILADIKSWQLSLPVGNPAIEISLKNLPVSVVERLKEIADTHIAVAISFSDDTEKP